MAPCDAQALIAQLTRERDEAREALRLVVPLLGMSDIGLNSQQQAVVDNALGQPQSEATRYDQGGLHPPLHLKCHQIDILRQFTDGDPEFTVCVADLPARTAVDGDHMEAGVYCWSADYPEEGVLLLPEDAVAQPQQQTTSFQQRVDQWMQQCFGPEISSDRQERSHRFLEESLELVQAAGCTQHEALQLVGYVYGRPAGELHQEIGGVAVTLHALCSAWSINLYQCADTELHRVWGLIERIRSKQRAKPKFSPLPVALAHPQGEQQKQDSQ